MERSRRSHSRKPVFKSKDRAFHEVAASGALGGIVKVYKDHPKKYDGKGNRVQ